MNSKKWETFYAVLLNMFVNCIAQEISCNEFGFFCADRIRFGNCIDYTNGTMSADVSFLIECPENTYCNIESVSICKEVTENTLQVSTTPSTALVHVQRKLNAILNGSNESKFSNDFSHSSSLDDSGDSEELDEYSDEDETEDSGNDSEDDNKSNDSSEFDESNNSDNSDW
uniref:(California timema) hypothetical protein n=1 Tax=Timema californicum TaxID=61474 RepID=A0A7R9P8P6_TIMCA|nr:unnamed protein product [Timema californicum]